ncbi:unnamed protein product, partial [Mesorhabditis belari]|uniref:U1-type domain-containing protein n=1 Tax=Mesorhabditis belari TaxID=2138241 RepID=A0AAF3F2V4_9BILA
MTEVWKSIGKHFCEICKVWMTDNKASRDFHERGLKHQAMIQQRIGESQKKARDRDKELMQHSSIIAQMEAAAVAQAVKYGEDLYHGPSLPSSSVSNIFDPRQHRGVAAMASEISRRGRGDEPVVDTSQFALPPDYSAGSSSGSVGKKGPPVPKPRSAPGQETFAEISGGPVRQLPSTLTGQDEEIVWVQAYMPKGKSYYWNIYTKEKRTKCPGSFLTPEEYFKRQQLLEMAGLPTTGVGLAPGHMNRAAKRAAAKSHPDQPIRPKKQPYVDRQQIKIEQDGDGENDTEIPLPGGFKEVKEEIDGGTDAEDAGQIETAIEEDSAAPKPSAFGAWVRVGKQEKKETFLSPLTAKYRELEEKEEEIRKEIAEKEPIIVLEARKDGGGIDEEIHKGHHI